MDKFTDQQLDQLRGLLDANSQKELLKDLDDMNDQLCKKLDRLNLHVGGLSQQIGAMNERQARQVQRQEGCFSSMVLEPGACMMHAGRRLHAVTGSLSHWACLSHRWRA